MLRSYLLAAIRNFIRNKTFSFINIFGLALGMASCFFIFHYIYFEKSYDSVNIKRDRLYRVLLETSNVQKSFPSAVTHPGVGPAMKEDYAEVEDFARLVDYKLILRNRELSYQAPNGMFKTFHQDRMFLTDASFFNLFSYPLLKGNRVTCLQRPYSLLLSETLAKKYFNTLDIVGKTMKLNNKLLFTVTGVFKDIPENTHIKFDVLVSLSTDGENWGYNEFEWAEFYTYVLLKPGTDVAAFEKKLSGFADRHMRSVMEQYHFKAFYHVQPITDIHLTSHYDKEAEANGSSAEVAFLSIIGVFILIIAWINYINLSTAKSIDRSKEVGIRKVAGASTKQVFNQFLVEAVVVNIASILLAAVLVFTAWSFVDNFVGKNINSEFFTTGLGSHPTFWLLAITGFICGTLVTGIYPALILSSFTPVDLFRSIMRKSSSSIILRKGLIAFQYVLSVLLIAGTLVVYQQLHYTRQQPLGYDINNIAVIKSPADTWHNAVRFDYLKQSLQQLPSVDAVSVTSDIPGESIVYQNGARRPQHPKGIYPATTNIIETDEQFFPAYHIPLVAGRNFNRADSVNLLKPRSVITAINVIISETLARDLGFYPASSAVNQPIYCLFANDEQLCNVVGVVKDYHQRSLKEKYQPIIYYCPLKAQWKYVSIRLKRDHAATTLAAIEKKYTDIFPESPFASFFLDDYFNIQYLPDQRLGKVFLLFSVLAIVIACLGIWGLSAFTLRLRVREVAIRKILGAPVRSLLLLLTADYFKLAALAAILTLPVIYMFSKQWLDNFAFHFEPGLLLCIAPSAIILIISLGTVLLQTLKVSKQSPTKVIQAQ
jgi:putative ABC transport system permease protein